MSSTYAIHITNEAGPKISRARFPSEGGKLVWFHVCDIEGKFATEAQRTQRTGKEEDSFGHNRWRFRVMIVQSTAAADWKGCGFVKPWEK